MDLTEDDFRNVSGQFSGQASIVEVGDAVDVRVETVKVDDQEQVLEAGDETYFPALRVGLQKTSSVVNTFLLVQSFWFDYQTGHSSSKKSVPVESSTTPLYNRGFTIGLDSGSNNVEGECVIDTLLSALCILLNFCCLHCSRGLEIIDDPPRCFNCGAYSHSIRECPRPFDRSAVSNARRQHKRKRNQTPGSRLPSRYYQSLQRGKYDGLKPGSLDAETRKLLGLKELDPPPWLNRMREIGYPPGYFAVEEDDDDHSRITIFGEEETKEEEEVKTEEGEILEKASPQEPRKIMTVGFPGINAPIPENADSWLWEQRNSNTGHTNYHNHLRPQYEMGPLGIQLSSSFPPMHGIRYDHRFGL
ncbi:F1N21.3 [Arabidopsis thaliana]|uniref:F1N21.3 n=1 Tax=Arabidopsis thaliana TaxID=3702 RepID=Q9FYH2_ARATH|nr:F1N21.3 [Arabidopsis thaliana]